MGRLRVPDLRRQGRSAQAVRRHVRQAEVHVPDERRPGARQGAGAASGRTSSIPCVDYSGNWVELGVVQPWDPALITNFKDLDPVLVKGGQIDGQQYFVPADWGFSSPLYRADKVEPTARSRGSSSTTTATRGRSRGGTRRSRTSSSGATSTGSTTRGTWTDDELDEAKEFLISKKNLCRNFWSSQTDLDADIAAATSGSRTPGAAPTSRPRTRASTSSTRAEGGTALRWNCGFVLARTRRTSTTPMSTSTRGAPRSRPSGSSPTTPTGTPTRRSTCSKVPEDSSRSSSSTTRGPARSRTPTTRGRSRAPTAPAYATRWDEVKAA